MIQDIAHNAVGNAHNLEMIRYVYYIYKQQYDTFRISLLYGDKVSKKFKINARKQTALKYVHVLYV